LPRSEPSGDSEDAWRTDSSWGSREDDAGSASDARRVGFDLSFAVIGEVRRGASSGGGTSVIDSSAAAGSVAGTSGKDDGSAYASPASSVSAGDSVSFRSRNRRSPSRAASREDFTGERGRESLDRLSPNSDVPRRFDAGFDDAKRVSRDEPDRGSVESDFDLSKR
jgi:hypothetical protein